MPYLTKIAFTVLLFCGLLSAQQNLLLNHNFELSDPDGGALHWTTHCTGSSTAGRTTEQEPRDQACGFIIKTADGHVSALNQALKVEGNTEYLLSALAKGKGTLFGYEYGENNEWIRCAEATGVNSNDWQPISVKVKTRPETRNFHVRFELYGEGKEGEGWVDEIYFGPPVEPQPAPRNLVASINDDAHVTLSWEASLPTGGMFQIFRSPYPDLTRNNTPLATTTEPTWIDTETSGTWSQFFYQVNIVDALHQNSESGNVALVQVKPAAAQPKHIVWTASVLDKVRRYQEPPTAPETPVLKLSMARNEAEAGQILVFAGNADIKQLQVTHGGFRRQGEQKLDLGLQANLFHVGYTMIDKPTIDRNMRPGLMADPLLPWRGPIDVPVNATQSIWLQFQTSRDCPAGTYEGTVILSDASGTIANVPVTLQIYDFTLPDEPSFMSAFAVWPGFIASAFDVKSGSPEHQRLKEQYYWFMVERRMPPDDLPVPITSPEAARFLDDPRVGSVRITCGWENVDHDKLKKVADHMRENNWLKKGYIYITDEPTPEQYEKCCKLAEAVHQVGADIPFLLTEQPEKELFGAVDIWCPVLSAIKWEDVDERRMDGDRLWWYTCCGPQAPYPTYLIDDVGISHRVLSWLQVKHDIEGVLYWCVNVSSPYRNGKYSSETKVWEYGEMFPRANGDGFLIYPGKQVGIDGPVTSVRLEIIRDGNEDVEYFNILKQRLIASGDKEPDNTIQALIEPLARNFIDWEKSPEVLYLQRQKVADTIVKLGK